MTAPTKTTQRRSRMAQPEPTPEPVAKRFVVWTPKGRVFLICSGCRHWVQRLLVTKCACCTSHAENPTAAKKAAESENENG